MSAVRRLRLTGRTDFRSVGIVNSDVSAVLGLLDRWRHLPAYRLEPRADPFFAHFLPEVVAARVGTRLHEVVIPEFPLRRGAWLSEDPSGNESTKVDYVFFSADVNRVFFVELKTDRASRRDAQDEYLEKSATVGFARLVEGVLNIVRATQPKYLQKYFHLLHALESLGLASVPPSAYERVFPEVRRGITKELSRIQNLVPADGPAVKVLYVEPVATSDDSIGFEEFAAIAEKRGELGHLFAAHLRSWTSKAGSVDPRKR